MNASPISLHTHVTLPAPNDEERVNARHVIITNIAKAALKELAIGLIFVGIACCFAATSLTITMMLTGLAAMAVFNTVFRSFYGYAAYQAFLLKYLPKDNADRIDAEAFASKIKRIVDWACPVSFANLVDGVTRDVIFHECGHALAASLLYKNSQPTITITETSSFGVTGLTTYYNSTLTALGEKLGSQNASLVVSAAGPAAAMLISTVNILLSQKFKESHPQLSRYLLMIAVNSVANHVIYALSALWGAKTNVGNDFIRLWLGGLNPIVAAVSMITVPLVIKGSFMLYDYHYSKPHKPIRASVAHPILAAV